MARGAVRTRRAGKPARRRAPEASRDAILDAALRCFAKRGYHETSIDDIAARARLSKGAVYWHFEGKRELFARSPEYVERELPLVKLWLQHLLQSGLDDGVRARADQKQERWTAIVERQLARGVAEGTARPVAPQDVVGAIGAVIGGLTLMRLTRPDLDLSSVWREVEEILVRGIRS